MSLEVVLLLAVLAFYTAATVVFLWSLSSSSYKTQGAVFLSAIGLVFHTGLIITTGVESGRAPFTNLRESLIFVGWTVMAVFIAIRGTRRPAILGAVVAVLCMVVTVFGFAAPKSTSDVLVPALRSRWSVVHVVTSLAGYAGFVLAFSSALLYTIQDSRLKSKQVNRVQLAFPPLDSLDRFSYRMVALGFPLFTVGIVTGSLWAQSAWGSYWSWDPKETWSLVTWLVYAAYLHVRLLMGRRGRLANRLLIIGFACTLMTFLGVNFLCEGLHKYNW